MNIYEKAYEDQVLHAFYKYQANIKITQINQNLISIYMFSTILNLVVMLFFLKN